MIILSLLAPAVILGLFLFDRPATKMKPLRLLTLMLLFSNVLFAQKKTAIDTIIPGKGSPKQQIRRSKEIKKQLLSDSTGGNEPQKSPLIDTTVKNKYGDLLNDDIKFNKKYPVWKPAVEIFGINLFTHLLDRYALNADFARIGPSTWKYNINHGWEWDSDRFGINFIGHPYSGSMTFNAARSQGYNYWQSFPFAVGGSLMWEYFGENTKPSYNDIINTPVNGAFLGEIFYRVSSDILDDRASGGNRVFREVIAGVIDPVRGLNRLLQGKSFRHTRTQVYQQEPLNITLSTGFHKINDNNKTVFGSGPNNVVFNLQLDYGNPFEIRARKPFDVFRFRTDFSLGSGRKILDNILGYGILFGKTTHWGKLAILYGAFQYYDYWDNRTFELGAIGFGGGLITKYPFSDNVNLYTNVHLSAIPLAGNSTRFGPDTTQVRDYTYNDGLAAKFEATFAWGKHLSASVSYYYYLLHTIVGPAGNNYVAILRPRINLQVYKNLSLGIEHFQYYDDRYLKSLAPIYSVRTEQKIYLTYFFEAAQRKGEYGGY